MRKSKFKVKTFVFSLAMAAGLITPLSFQGQNESVDGFFRGGSEGYENRDEGGITTSANISNETFGVPLGSGLLILSVVGLGYALKK